MAGILLTRDRIHAHLRSLGHEPTGDMFIGQTGSYRWWKTPWGDLFAVPDEDYKCATWQLERIIERVNSHRPPVH